MVELARGTELADVTLSGFVGDVERSGDFDVGGTVEGVGERIEEARTRCLGELTRAFGRDGGQAFVRMPWKGLVHFDGVKEKHLDNVKG